MNGGWSRCSSTEWRGGSVLCLLAESLFFQGVLVDERGSTGTILLEPVSKDCA